MWCVAAKRVPTLTGNWFEVEFSFHCDDGDMDVSAVVDVKSGEVDIDHVYWAGTREDYRPTAGTKRTIEQLAFETAQELWADEVHA